MAENQVALINTRKSMSPVKPAQIVVYSSRKICKYVREERDGQILFDSQNKISKKKLKTKILRSWRDSFSFLFRNTLHFPCGRIHFSIIALTTPNPKS